MILFLDFDDVLHPFQMRPTDHHFSWMNPLWKILDRSPKTSVMITSTWRKRYSFAELTELLRTHGGRRFIARFLGVTQVLGSATVHIPGNRQREIEAWQLENKAASTLHNFG
jgi:hypothetical protein